MPSKDLVDQKLEEIGFGFYQLFLFITCGLGYMADSMWFSIPSSILIPLSADFGLPPSSVSAVASCLVSGMIFGSIGFGLVANKFGRVPCFYLSFVLPPIFGIISALSNSFILICICFAFIGIGIGGNVPVDSSLFIESIASKYQYLLVLLTIFWSFAGAFGTWLAWMIIPRYQCTSGSYCYGWRYLLYAVSSFSMLCLILRMIFRLHETPRWLISKGKMQDAVHVLTQMASLNGKLIQIDVDDFEVDLEIDSADNSWFLFWNSNEWSFVLIRTAVLLSLIWMGTSLGFGMFGSFLTVFLKDGAKLSVDETYWHYLIISLCGIPGTILISFLVDSNLGRKWVLCLSTLGCSICLHLFTIDSSAKTQWIVSCIFQFLGNCMWGTLYTYTTEVYPTSLRTIGFGFSSSLGRIAGAFAPVLSGLLIEKSLYVTLHVSSAILVFVGCLMIFLPLETKGRGIY